MPVPRPPELAAATATVFDPDTYCDGVPYAVLAGLRREYGVAWVDESPILGGPAGPGFWLVLRHAEVEAVLRDPRGFSSWLGGGIGHLFGTVVG